jgi:hypothetical protein
MVTAKIQHYRQSLQEWPAHTDYIANTAYRLQYALQNSSEQYVYAYVLYSVHTLLYACYNAYVHSRHDLHAQHF